MHDCRIDNYMSRLISKEGDTPVKKHFMQIIR